ncbi:hypothetical protein CFN78_21975 [Amycolatopsis antarctica]|uniref:Uncharacterized protein n=1 Tax=Amycolatopsis antarctica TaxID=1854586 RepID=A0A263CYA1_9PSEU|nr:hypothetical protein [Amycolatopsis antarctica]OZM71133.1 hypothetical protein CFN78_21975 [Amycolatopsis antarctica]
MPTQRDIPLPTSPAERESPVPDEVVATLRDLAVRARQIADQLTVVQAGYPPNAVAGPDPVFVALDQGVAAAHDVCADIDTAIGGLAGRE